MKRTFVFTGVQRTKEKVRKVNSSTWLFVVEIVLMALLCYVHSVRAGHYANYFPINGTFQNYNPVRRLLNGQIPYRDFQDYLGMGHLYIGTLFTVIFGETYRASLIAFSFLTFGGLALLSFTVGLAVLKKKEISAAITNMVLVMLLIEPAFFKNTVSGTSEILEALEYTLGTGNSARLVRGLILPLSIMLIWSAYKVYLSFSQKNNWIRKHKNFITYAGIGFIAGFSFVWCNDYGISCWVCAVISAFWLSLARTRKFVKSLTNTGIEIVTSLFGIIITVLIFTCGHLLEWFTVTFETGGYQSWYYNSTKSYYLYDVDFSWIMLIQAGICIVYLVKLFIDRGRLESIRRYGIPGFANMVCFCAVNEYQMLSGGGAREVSLATLFLTIIFEICSFMSRPDRKKKEQALIAIASIVTSLAFIISSAKEEFIFKYMSDLDGTYVEAMGGNLTSLGEDLIQTNDFLNGKNFFATYASAQEVLSGKFQPSGTDYIIHVLGDQQRSDYLNTFENGDFEYAATINETYTDWEYWVRTANWFFYRELYSKWNPVYANTYEVYWERNTEDIENTTTENIVFSVEDISDTCKKLIIQTDSDVNGIADVYIDYSVNKKDSKSALFVFQRSLKVENTGKVYAGQGSYYESNYLRAQSQEYIPISVVNGYGEVTITAGPQRSTYLQLNKASCERIFTCTSEYLEIADITYDDNGSIIRINNTSKNMNAIAGTLKIELQETSYNVREITNDENNIYICIDEYADYEKCNGNYIRLIE